MSTLNQRIRSIIAKNLQKQQSQSIDIISQLQHLQKHKPITQCVDKLFNLIVKLQQSKIKRRKQFPVEIRNKIFIGNYVHAGDQGFLTKNNVGLVVSCLDVAPTKILPNINYEKIPIKDREGENLLIYSDKIFTLIEAHLSQNPQTSIFIHWSVAVLVMYLMRKEGRRFDGVYGQVKGKYNVAKVNGWFEKQLKEYEKTLDLQKKNKNQSEELMMIESGKNNNNHDLLSYHSNDLLGLTSNSTIQASQTNSIIPYHPSPSKKQQQYLIQIQVDQDDNQNPVQNAQLI